MLNRTWQPDVLQPFRVLKCPAVYTQQAICKKERAERCSDKRFFSNILKGRWKDRCVFFSAVMIQTRTDRENAEKEMKNCR